MTNESVKGILQNLADNGELQLHEVLALDSAIRMLDEVAPRDAFAAGAMFILGDTPDDFEQAQIEEAYEKWLTSMS